MLHQVAWPGLTRPLDELVAAPSGLWIVEHRPWQDIAVARGRVITADADVTLDVQHLDQVRVRVARDLGLTPDEAHALVVVPEEVPALRLEGVVIVGQRLVRQIILSPGRRLTPTQLDVLARRTAKVLGQAPPDQPQAPPQVAVDPDPAPELVVERPAASPFNRLPSSRPAPRRTAADRRVPSEPAPSTEPVPELTPASAAPETDRLSVPAPDQVRPTTREPAGPGRAGAPELLASVPEPHDEPPPPLPTPEEMGLPPALLDPPSQHQTSVDPIWPIAPPPGLWIPEPEPELAQLVALDPEPDALELDTDESDLERTRVVESASTVPEVDEDESEMGRTRVVDYPTSRPYTAPDRGLPRLVDPGPGEPDDAWPEPDWPESLDEPGPVDLVSTEAGLTEAELVDLGPVDPEPIDPELVAELVATGMIDPEMLADLIDAHLIDPEAIDPERIGALATAEPDDPAPVADDLVATVVEPDRVDEDGLDRPGEDLTDETTPEPVADAPDRPGAVYQALDEAVELTRIRPPDRPPASPSLADARRAFFSGADDPVTAFPQMPEDEAPAADEAPVADEAPGPTHGRRPDQTRPPDRLPVAWDDDPAPPSDGSRPHVEWDPPEAPPRGARPRVAWDEAVPEPDQPDQPDQPEAAHSDRRSVVAGPRPPTDHRPVEHTERPAQQAERPPRYRSGAQAARPPAAPPEEPGPPPYAARRGPVAPGGSAGPGTHRPSRPRAVRTGPWNLSPAQAAAVGGRFPGPVRIRGAFGTGRSVAVAYRAVHLAQTRPGLVAIVVPAAAQVEPMRRRLQSVASTDVLERIVVDVPAGIARSVLAEFGTEVDPAPESVARAWSVAQRSTGLGAAQGRSIGLLLDEVALIRGRSLTSEGDYARLRQEMPSGLRHQVWVLHETYLAELRRRNLPDEHDLIRMARAALRAGVPSELTAVVVDDANDLTLDQLTMLRETVGTGTDALTVVDDGLPGLLPVGATLGEAGIDIAQRQVDLAHEFRLTGPAWTSLVRLLEADTGRDVVGTTDRPRLAGRLDDGEGPAYLRSQAIRLRRDKLVERVVELIGEGVPPESIALLHIEDEPEPELVAELVRAGVMVRGLDALDVPTVALGRSRDARGVEFDHVLVPDARHRDVVPVGSLRWDQRQRRRLLGLALSRSRETAWIAGV
ncbi:MAG: hypothetical protein FWH11_11670 [Micrococcales bacterium]|nr:hypothetical protein [Micrococcales bacterium]